MSFDEAPLSSSADLLDFYGYKDIEEAKSDLPIIQSLFSLRDQFKGEFNITMPRGKAIAVEAPWGKGKTSFVLMLKNELLKTDEVQVDNFCWFFYDSLFYGNVSESITILIEELFKEIETTFAIKLKKKGQTIAKNLTPKVEVNGILPRFSFAYNKTRNTQEILTDHIREEMLKIEGKVYVVIDDLDRLSSRELHSFLRLVRVLKELPNTYILLPLAYNSIVDLLSKENIANPGGYVRKIFDQQVQIEFGLEEAKRFFKNRIKTEIGVENDKTYDDLWHGYLWELSLYALRTHEINQANGQRLTVDVNVNDSTAWSLLEELETTKSTNFVREIFGQTRRDYGSPKNYVMKFPQGNNFRYVSYRQVASGATPSQLFDGRFHVANDYKDLQGGKNILEMQLYPDEQLGGDKDDYVDVLPEKSQSIDSQREILWDIVRDVPENYFPPNMNYMISARMLKRLMDYLVSRHKDEITSNSTGNIYTKLKSTLSKYVEDNAKVVN